MVGPEFTSCWLKLGRAEEHFNTFKAEIIAWNKGQPYIVSKKSDAEGRRHSLVVEIKNAPLDRWALIAGDCIHNLRSVLDNLVYAVAVRESRVSPPPKARTLQFPIAESSQIFAKQNWRIASLSSKVQARIEGAQPYNRPHPELPPLLGILSEFDDFDKHRLLNVVFANVAHGKFSFTGVGQQPIIPSAFGYHPGTVESGAEFAWFTMQPPKRDVDYKYEATFVVSVTHSAGPSGRTTGELGYVLEILIAEVRRIVDDIGVLL
jgi:hypothetical protein